ncbi:helix-turn-helix domain-containing protein, partial [Mycobacterium avium]
MSFSKLTWLKRTDGHKFTGTEFRVLVALYNHTDAQGRNAFPGLDLLVEETGYRKSGISEAISSLKARGWIRETRKGSGLSGKASSFDLVPDAPKPPNSSAVA